VGLEIELDATLKPPRETDDTTELIPPYFLNRHKVSDSHTHITFVYFAKAKTDKVSQGIDELSEECKWFTKKELEQNKELMPNVRFYAIKALETV